MIGPGRKNARKKKAEETSNLTDGALLKKIKNEISPPITFDTHLSDPNIPDFFKAMVATQMANAMDKVRLIHADTATLEFLKSEKIDISTIQKEINAHKESIKQIYTDLESVYKDCKGSIASKPSKYDQPEELSEEEQIALASSLSLSQTLEEKNISKSKSENDLQALESSLSMSNGFPSTPKQPLSHSTSSIATNKSSIEENKEESPEAKEKKRKETIAKACLRINTLVASLDKMAIENYDDKTLERQEQAIKNILQFCHRCNDVTSIDELIAGIEILKDFQATYFNDVFDKIQEVIDAKVTSKLQAKEKCSNTAEDIYTILTRVYKRLEIYGFQQEMFNQDLEQLNATSQTLMLINDSSLVKTLQIRIANAITDDNIKNEFQPLLDKNTDSLDSFYKETVDLLTQKFDTYQEKERLEQERQEKMRAEKISNASNNLNILIEKFDTHLDNDKLDDAQLKAYLESVANIANATSFPVINTNAYARNLIENLKNKNLFDFLSKEKLETLPAVFDKINEYITNAFQAQQARLAIINDAAKKVNALLTKVYFKVRNENPTQEDFDDYSRVLANIKQTLVAVGDVNVIGMKALVKEFKHKLSSADVSKLLNEEDNTLTSIIDKAQHYISLKQEEYKAEKERQRTQELELARERDRIKKAEENKQRIENALREIKPLLETVASKDSFFDLEDLDSKKKAIDAKIKNIEDDIKNLNDEISINSLLDNLDKTIPFPAKKPETVESIFNCIRGYIAGKLAIYTKALQELKENSDNVLKYVTLLKETISTKIYNEKHLSDVKDEVTVIIEARIPNNLFSLVVGQLIVENLLPEKFNSQNRGDVTASLNNSVVKTSFDNKSLDQCLDLLDKKITVFTKANENKNNIQQFKDGLNDLKNHLKDNEELSNTDKLDLAKDTILMLEDMQYPTVDQNHNNDGGEAPNASLNALEQFDAKYKEKFLPATTKQLLAKLIIIGLCILAGAAIGAAVGFGVGSVLGATAGAGAGLGVGLLATGLSIAGAKEAFKKLSFFQVKLNPVKDKLEQVHAQGRTFAAGR